MFLCLADLDSDDWFMESENRDEYKKNSFDITSTITLPTIFIISGLTDSTYLIVLKRILLAAYELSSKTFVLDIP